MATVGMVLRVPSGRKWRVRRLILVWDAKPSQMNSFSDVSLKIQQLPSSAWKDKAD